MIDITQSVVDSLYSEFGDGISYIVDDYEQGLKEPCFLVSIINDDIDMELNGDGWYNASVNIVYIQDKEDRIDKLEKKLRVFSTLENIEVRGQNVYAQSIESNTDRELNIIAKYSIRTTFRVKEKLPKMNKIEQERYDA